MIPLKPCPACARHVLMAEVDCPFCRAPLPRVSPDGVRVPSAGVRAATALLGVALATSACTKTELEAPPAPSPPDHGRHAVPAYGAPPVPPERPAIDAGAVPSPPLAPNAADAAPPRTDAGADGGPARK